MSLNIAPQIPQVIVNSAAPATEALARANATRDVVPAPTQVEPYVAQPSREQESRTPTNQQAVTYENILQRSDNQVIPEDALGQQSEEQPEQQAGEQNQSGDESANVDGQQAEASAEDNEDSGSDAETEQQAQQRRAEERVEQAEQREELAEIRQLEQRDAEVRAHEQAHASVGGQYAGNPSYEYERGPNGKEYAVGGEVPIDVSVAGTPQETIRKMQTVRAAALAPAEPSSQDRKVAAEASRKLSEARSDLIDQTQELQQTRSQGADSEEDDSEIQVNTDSPFGELPRNRVLNGINGNNEQGAQGFVEASDANSRLEQESDEGNNNRRDQQIEQTASVVYNRYASSSAYQQADSGLSIVA